MDDTFYCKTEFKGRSFDKTEIITNYSVDEADKYAQRVHDIHFQMLKSWSQCTHKLRVCGSEQPCKHSCLHPSRNGYLCGTPTWRTKLQKLPLGGYRIQTPSYFWMTFSIQNNYG